jgi:hypothetical protein
MVFFFLALILAGIIYRWISLERLQRAAPVEVRENTTPTPAAEPSPSHPPVIAGKIDTAKLFNGVTVQSTVETPAGVDASTERADPQSYVLDLKLLVRVPTPNKNMDELARISPRLPALLPGLATMITPDSVSPLYQDLYNAKLKIVRDSLGHLEQLLSRHNFYDCQTVLRLQHPQSHRKALLLQADMDVDADGSDADRLPAGSGAPTNFKPFTSYRWTKKTDAINPYLPMIEDKLRRGEEEITLKTTAPDRKRDLHVAIPRWREEIATLKKFSFLIGTTDPYIVLPGIFTRGKEGAKVGDYAVVIYGDGLYPAIVGDVGPNDKTGEASLRIAKEVNTQSNAYNRPVSDLKVTYLIFPGSADTPFGPPDLEKLHAQCQKLVDEIGGASAPLHRWENIIPPPPTPTPSPSASLSPSASPDANQTVPIASPSATFAFPLASPTATP